MPYWNNNHTAPVHIVNCHIDYANEWQINMFKDLFLKNIYFLLLAHGYLYTPPFLEPKLRHIIPSIIPKVEANFNFSKNLFKLIDFHNDKNA